MAYTSAESAIRGIVYRIGKIKQTCQITTGTDFWSRVDAAADETYENRVKGSTITAVDTAFEAGNLGDNTSFQPLLTLHNDYLVQDLSYAGWDAWLTANKWRVPQEFADMFYEWSNSRFTTTNVAPYDNVSRGYFILGGSLVAGTNVDTTYTGLGGVKARVAVKGAAAWDLTITMAFNAAGTDTGIPNLAGQSYSVRVASSAPVDTEYIIGEVAMAENEAAGQTVIQLAETAPYKAGYQVLLYDNNAQEIGTVFSVQADASITLTTGIRHSYTTAASAKVRALYHHLTLVEETGGNASDRVNFFTQADTTLAL